MREQIKECFKKILDLDDVPDDISSTTCVKWDSLNHLYLMMELETVFKVSLLPDEIAEMKSLPQIEAMLTAKTNKDK